MKTDIFHQLHNDGLITQDELTATSRQEETRLLSLHWDLRSLLYSGILMLATGIGILIYKNIDAIGHLTVVVVTGLLSAICIGYCIKKSAPYGRYKVESPNLWFDYILLLGCLLMVTFLGYLQFRFHVFGMRWGLATFVPMVLLFGMAYYFDHKGVLSLAITAMGAWLGVAVDPVKFIRSDNLGDESYITSGVILGVVLSIMYVISGRVNVKSHFSLTYKNFGIHVLMIALICGMLNGKNDVFWWLLVLAVVAVWHFMESIRDASFYFLLFTVLYSYIGLSGFIIKLLLDGSFNEGAMYMLIFYFIGSAIGAIALLRHYNHKFNLR